MLGGLFNTDMEEQMKKSMEESGYKYDEKDETDDDYKTGDIAKKLLASIDLKEFMGNVLSVFSN